MTQTEAEAKVGIKFQEVFFAVGGLQLKADGFEGRS
jgi:hypothetical protein